MREFMKLVEFVIRRSVEVDHLPDQVKADIVDMMMTRNTGFIAAYEAEYGRHSLSDENVRGEIFGVNSPIRVDVLNLNPKDIDSEGRQVSDLAVQNYVDMLQDSSPPPVLVRHNGVGWQIVEGGHRLAAAKAAGVGMIGAVDVTDFFQRDWESYIRGED